MILQFLRLFSTFRELEARVVVLQVEADMCHRRADAREEDVRLLNRQLADSLKQTADAFARVATGRNVFARASENVVEMPPPSEPIKPVRKLGREVVQAETRKFFEDAAKEAQAARSKTQ